jgi:uncharacterized ubiquitin-like protein YukD
MILVKKVVVIVVGSTVITTTRTSMTLIKIVGRGELVLGLSFLYGKRQF